jgi:hypothetical protein
MNERCVLVFSVIAAVMQPFLDFFFTVHRSKHSHRKLVVDNGDLYPYFIPDPARGNCHHQEHGQLGRQRGCGRKDAPNLGCKIRSINL